jgi:hypothetical protein
LVGERRVLYLVVLMIFYLAIYSLSKSGGSVPRYLIALCPFVPMMIAWAAYDLGRRHLIPAALFVTLFVVLQIPFVVQFARDDTILEWDVRTHGGDIRKLANFLLANNLTTVVTPYEIKWKLMFESRGKIVCAAYLFGFDRDPKYNTEVVDRVNRRKMPVAFVFDKEYKLPRVALKINPEGAFNLEAFHALLQRSRITYQITPVGQDYVVYHGFSKPLSLIAH